ncbi:MAG: cupin domain-containing protein [Methanomicrobiales archaeon]|nr:cupin domain-containing protein [Methanomicrobiales archaeon]
MDNEKNLHITMYELAEFSQKNFVKKDLIQKEGFGTFMICLDQGQEIPPHSEPHGGIFLVLEGKGDITSKESRYDVGPGHLVSVEANGIRGIQCIERMIILVIK